MSNEVFEQRFIANGNETNTVFELSLDIIRDYEKRIQDLEKQNEYLSERNQILEKSNDDFVNLYTNACYHFGESWDVFYENNVDYQYFEQEVVNHETEEKNGEENERQYSETIISRNLNFNDCVASQIIELSDDERSVYTVSDGYDDVYDVVFKEERREYNENYSFYNNDNFDYDEKKSESDGYEEFLEQREHDDYERYLEDKNTQNFLYYMSQRN
ncbi:7577_t:CDS:1 [Cetraspora pellucida]|uniref:7577_t:CDS:1 n=1 Tax=Cetraspora pellucida TaxID=1433469 RepID=A0ACA9PWU5_9GLOM|nr:7577_t:CDS:1 [Cetraspora pellucida]